MDCARIATLHLPHRMLLLAWPLPPPLLACMFMCGPNMTRAAATDHSSSSRGGSGAEAMAVSGLAQKFWMISSWS